MVTILETVSYKCPSCSAPLTFSDQKQDWHCGSCGNEYPLETLKDIYDNDILKGGDAPLDWKDYDFQSGSGDWTEEEKAGLQQCRCKSCGAEVITDKNTAATHCAYCGNTVVIPEQLSGVFRPDYIIPFQIGKERAVEEYKKFCAGKRLLPKSFLKDNHIEEISGLYVPFWLYDCDVDGGVVFDAKRVMTHNDGKFITTHTDHYRINRAGSMRFDRVPVDGSKKLADEYMEAIEPFNYAAIAPFSPSYLSGFLSDKYDVTAKDGAPRADGRVKSTFEEALRGTVEGYSSVTVAGRSVKTGDSDIKYALLPVWLLNTRYKDDVYTFAMNGQTGKLIGKLPVDKGLYWKYLIGMGAGFSAAAFAVTLVLKAMGVL